MNANDPNTQAVLTAVRAVLIAMGGFIVQRGYMTDSAWQEVVGALMAILPTIWGAIEHYRVDANKKAEVAQAINVGIAVADRTPGITPPVPADKAPAVIEAFKPVVPAPDSPAQNPTGLAIQPSSPILTDQPKGSTP